MAIENFQEKLQKYADIAVHVGLNLHPGQNLLIRGPMVFGVPFSAAPLIYEITKSAYRAGAKLVDVVWGDEQMELLRFQNAPRNSFSEFSDWKATGPFENARAGNAAMTITGLDPDLLSQQDPELVSQYYQTCWEKLDPFLKVAGRNDINWLVLAVPTAGWCSKVFPDLPVEEREEKMWETLFKLCRIDQPDPVQAWTDHIRNLTTRSTYLNQRSYTAFHYTGPGTDLTVGLPEGHHWHAAQSDCVMGFPFTANIPTEEVYTLPHRNKVDGVVRASKPLNYNGLLIDGIVLKFENGRVIEATARIGDSILKNLIATDEGAARLGEVAIVPYSSPISQSGLLFYNTLFDENASCHLALGKAYETTLQDGASLTPEEFVAAGGNTSVIHVDFMIGSNQMDIDGITREGVAEPVLRSGEWAFSV